MMLYILHNLIANSKKFVIEYISIYI
jgi:hypothetical protein